MSTVTILQPREILNYKRFGSETSLTNIEIPETAQNRQRTDKYFLYVFIGLIVLLMPLLIYTLYYSDIRRINGYDKCGNICGEKNVKYDQWNCTGKDMTDKPKYSDRECVAAVTPKTTWSNNYYDNRNYHDDRNYLDEFRSMSTHEDHNPDEDIKNAYAYIERVGFKIALSAFLSLGYCVIMVVLFRHATAVLVWGILVLSWICLLFFTLYLWIYVVGSGSGSGGVAVAICLSIVVLALLCVMMFLYKKIGLVIMLIKESTKAVFDMTPIFIVPVLAMLMLIIIAIAWTASTSYMYTSGILTESWDETLDYIPNSWMVATIVFNTIMAYWATQFIGGIQFMVVSGAISKWYFTRNKALLSKPILTSVIVAFKFHLGTIALGSLIITLVMILRAFLKTLASNPRLKLLVQCCMSYLEGVLKFFTKNSYIVTAMHGTPFFQSAKQAVKLIALNICNTIAVNYIGDFVLAMAQVLIVCLSVLTTYVLLLGDDSEYSAISYIIVGVFAVICSYTILATFQTAVDTMFLCFCEDCLINDGVTKPYAMSRGFMEFVQGSKKLFERKIQEKGLPTI